MGRIKNLIRNINYLSKRSLYDQREEDIVYLTNKILDDGFYEYSLQNQKESSLMIQDKYTSIDKIVSEGKSFVRYSDGEIRLMMGLDQPFQKYEQEIVDIFIDTMQTPRDDMYVAINREYFIPGEKHNYNYFIRRNAYDFRQVLEKYCNPSAEYLDATCTFFKWGEQSNEAEKFWDGWKKAFKGKDIVIVCGEHILDDLKFDIFELASSKRYIWGPKRHAWDKKDEILEQIYKEDKNTLIIFILGMAGKAMLPIVSKKGYIAWDLGHLAKSYNAYMTNMPATKENIAKFYAPD